MNMAKKMTLKKQRSSRKAQRKTQSGGKRKASPWNMFVKGVYDEMKKENPEVSFKEALVEASKLKKAGKMKK